MSIPDKVVIRLACKRGQRLAGEYTGGAAMRTVRTRAAQQRNYKTGMKEILLQKKQMSGLKKSHRNLAVINHVRLGKL